MTKPRPRIAVIGASHHATPVSIRERLSVPPERIPELYETLGSLAGVRELAILSTCNRLEVYCVLDDATTEEKIDEALCAFQEFPVAEFLQHRFVIRNSEMISHLFAVAAGVDSQIVGEAEILGQVKNAYSTAAAQNATGPILNRVFQKCFQSAKYIRSNTTIGEGRVNVATVAADLALKIFSDLGSCRVLVLGTGEVGEKTTKVLASRGAKSITVLSRAAERAETLAATVGGDCGTMDQIEEALASHDIVVGSTTTTDPVITSAMAHDLMRKRRLRPLFLIDLGMPRNFDPAITELESVFVYDLDDLAHIADENLAARRAAIEHCREIAHQRAERVWHGVEPRLFAHFETLRDEALRQSEQPS